MYKLLKNPFYVYVFGFGFTFLVYALDWSNRYPNLTLEIKIFFAITFFSFLFLGVLADKLKVLKKTIPQTKLKVLKISLYTVYFFFFLEILFEQDLPLLAKMLNRPGIEYYEFGLPFLHGVIVSFNSFLIAHAFAMYMSTKRRKILIYYLLLYLPAILSLNRSVIVFGLITSVFIYIHFVNKIKIKTQVKLTILTLVCFFLFGLVGNFRNGGEYIYSQSEATLDFMESSIPKEYYWSYLYIASPLANFQNTINKKKVTKYNIKGFVFYENLPKIISKNLGEPLGIERRDLVRIVPWLTVGTTYGRSFSYLEWYGPYFLFLSSLFVYLSVLFLIPRNSSYRITCISILSVIVFLNIFTNILIVTGISFQLAYCVIFAFFERKIFVCKT